AILHATLCPPVYPYKLGKAEAITYLRGWLSEDEGLTASKVLREAVKTNIQQHIAGMQMEAQIKGMIAMAGQPPPMMPPAGGNGGNPNDHKSQARANMKAPQPNKQPEPRPQLQSQ